MGFTGSEFAGSSVGCFAAIWALEGDVSADGFRGVVTGPVEEFFYSLSGESCFFGDHVAGPVFF